MTELVLANMPLAFRLVATYGNSSLYDDLRQYALLGLVEAAWNYIRLGPGCEFPRYARGAIVRKIAQGFRDFDMLDLGTRRAVLAKELVVETTSTHDPKAPVSDPFNRVLVLELLEQAHLSEPHRQAVVWKYLLDRPLTWLAQKEGLRKSTVQHRCRAGMRKLKATSRRSR